MNDFDIDAEIKKFLGIREELLKSLDDLRQREQALVNEIVKVDGILEYLNTLKESMGEGGE